MKNSYGTTVKILILRHGLARDRNSFRKRGLSDSLRPLTEEGAYATIKMAKTIRRILKEVDVIITSPFLRARETADILAREYPLARVVESNEMKPFVTPVKTLRTLQKMGRVTSVALVGHEPHLSRFMSFALTGSSRSLFDIKKAGFAILEFKTKIEKKQAQVQCLLQPTQLKKIKRK